ncbi:MAG: Plug domain-containing protein, partial [Bradyrhizobium sp.]|nr:Plug domain-containing protein [Bradyrhizobium sp.]
MPAKRPPARTRSASRRNAPPPPSRADRAPEASSPGVAPAFAGGQVALGGRVGLLGNVPTMKSPFNVASYTDNLIRDRQAATAADALILDPSVRSTHPGGGVLDSFNIRGFPIGEGNSGEFAFEGLYGIAPTYRLFTDYIERIEVLKGPSAALSGA